MALRTFVFLTLRLNNFEKKGNSSFLIKTSIFKILEFNQLKISSFLFVKTLAEMKFCCIFAPTIQAGFGSSVG